MIFVSLGTQKFQFNRILEYIDELIEENIISDQVFAQIGFSTYKPKNYQFSTFLSEKSFDDLIKNCTILITHGGVSSINKGLINNKKIIVIPRSSSFNEHIDDHQKEFTSKLAKKGYLLECNSKQELIICLKRIDSFIPKIFNLENSVKEIESKIIEFIERN